MKNLLVTLIAGVLSMPLFAQKSLEKIWVSDQQLPVPESVLYLSEASELWVSLIDGAGNEADGKGGLAKLHADGSLKDATWVEGLNAPKGMALNAGKLYIADLTEVVVIDAASGKILEKIPVEGATFLNDVTANDLGVVFVSDTRQNKVYQIKEHQPSVFLEEAPSANGLKAIGTDLYVLAGPELWKVDTATKNKSVLAKGFEQGGDGIEPVGNGDFIVTCWAGLIYYVKADGTFEKLLDVQGKMNTADLGFNAAEGILYVPTFNNNSVVAYKLK